MTTPESIIQNARVTGDFMGGPTLNPSGVLEKGVAKNILVSMEEALKLESMFRQDVFNQAAFKVIIDNLIGGGIQIFPADSGKVITEEFQFLIKEYWPTFTIDMLAHLFCFGYAVRANVLNREATTISDSSKQPIYIPKCIHRRLYNLVIKRMKDFSTVYEIRRIDSVADPDPQPVDMHLVIMKGYAPDEFTGEHKSICSKLWWDYKILMGIERSFVSFVQQRAHPPVVIEVQEQKHVNTTSEMNSTATYVETILPHLNNENEATALTEKQAENVIANARMESSPLPQGSYLRLRLDLMEEGHLLNKNILGYAKPHTIEDNIHPLPEGYTMSSRQPELPDFPIDFMQLCDRFRDKTFSLYGIPPARAFPTLTSSSGNSTTIKLDDNDLQRMNQTMRIIRDMALGFLEESYVDIYKVDRVDIKMKFPLYPNATLMQLFTAIDQNMIEERYGHEIAIQIMGLPEDAYFEGENEHKRPRVNGNENTVTEMIEARIRNINADSKARLADAEKKEAEAEVVGEPEGEVNAEMVEGEKELIDKQIELEETKLEAAIAKVEMQMKLLKEQVKANRSNASSQVKVQKATAQANRASANKRPRDR